MAPLGTAKTIIAKYISGIMGSIPMRVVKYIETTPTIPVANIKRKTNLVLELFKLEVFTTPKTPSIRSP